MISMTRNKQMLQATIVRAVDSLRTEKQLAKRDVEDATARKHAAEQQRQLELKDKEEAVKRTASLQADQAKQVKRDAEDKAAAVEKARQVAAEKTSLVEGMSLLRTIANAPWDEVGNDGVWSCFNEGTSDGALMMAHAVKLCYLDPDDKLMRSTTVDLTKATAPNLYAAMMVLHNQKISKELGNFTEPASDDDQFLRRRCTAIGIAIRSTLDIGTSTVPWDAKMRGRLIEKLVRYRDNYLARSDAFIDYAVQELESRSPAGGKKRQATLMAKYPTDFVQDKNRWSTAILQADVSVRLMARQQIESTMGVGELYERVTAFPFKEWLKKTVKPSSLENMLTDQRLERPLQKREARIARDAAIDGMSDSRLDQLMQAESADIEGIVRVMMGRATDQAREKSFYLKVQDKDVRGRIAKELRSGRERMYNEAISSLGRGKGRALREVYSMAIINAEGKRLVDIATQQSLDDHREEDYKLALTCLESTADEGAGAFGRRLQAATKALNCAIHMKGNTSHGERAREVDFTGGKALRPSGETAADHMRSDIEHEQKSSLATIDSDQRMAEMVAKMARSTVLQCERSIRRHGRGETLNAALQTEYGKGDRTDGLEQIQLLCSIIKGSIHDRNLNATKPGHTKLQMVQETIAHFTGQNTLHLDKPADILADLGSMGTGDRKRHFADQRKYIAQCSANAESMYKEVEAVYRQVSQAPAPPINTPQKPVDPSKTVAMEESSADETLDDEEADQGSGVGEMTTQVTATHRVLEKQIGTEHGLLRPLHSVLMYGVPGDNPVFKMLQGLEVTELPTSYKIGNDGGKSLVDPEYRNSAGDQCTPLEGLAMVLETQTPALRLRRENAQIKCGKVDGKAFIDTHFKQVAGAPDFSIFSTRDMIIVVERQFYVEGGTVSETLRGNAKERMRTILRTPGEKVVYRWVIHEIGEAEPPKTGDPLSATKTKAKVHEMVKKMKLAADGFFHCECWVATHEASDPQAAMDESDQSPSPGLAAGGGKRKPDQSPGNGMSPASRRNAGAAQPHAKQADVEKGGSSDWNELASRVACGAIAVFEASDLVEQPDKISPAEMVSGLFTDDSMTKVHTVFKSVAAAGNAIELAWWSTLFTTNPSGFVQQINEMKTAKVPATSESRRQHASHQMLSGTDIDHKQRCEDVCERLKVATTPDRLLGFIGSFLETYLKDFGANATKQVRDYQNWALTIVTGAMTGNKFTIARIRALMAAAWVEENDGPAAAACQQTTYESEVHRIAEMTSKVLGQPTAGHRGKKSKSAANSSSATEQTARLWLQKWMYEPACTDHFVDLGLTFTDEHLANFIRAATHDDEERVRTGQGQTWEEACRARDEKGQPTDSKFNKKMSAESSEIRMRRIIAVLAAISKDNESSPAQPLLSGGADGQTKSTNGSGDTMTQW